MTAVVQLQQTACRRPAPSHASKAPSKNTRLDETIVKMLEPFCLATCVVVSLGGRTLHHLASCECV